MNDLSTDKQAVQVWDISIRLFHWSLVAGIGFQWYSGEEGGNIMLWHMYIGYSLLGLILYRFVWGFIGSTYARFSDFLKGPKYTISYAKKFLKGEKTHYLGHNPLGGWMAVTLMLLVFIQASTGLFSSDDIMTEGPLFSLVSESIAYTLTDIHEINFNLILIFAGLHIIAVIYHRLIKKESLIKSMLTGKKISNQANTSSIKTNYLLMLISAGLVALCVYMLVNIF
ncbi:cytochrome b/b6 domain-containing protein [Neptunomonas antarctica]|uniref:Cytochrome b n=1 Tax=Neptunomonas antarctica TaxID=619304 RepID=A0A1N7P972_9GAMM|nr:cytochrome b/b6 domain-containing protein [Neptunomonas antarctica]SIT07076.1 Cytochrome b [Neptunomonas antarctica]